MLAQICPIEGFSFDMKAPSSGKTKNQVTLKFNIQVELNLRYIIAVQIVLKILII